jgi:cyclopropane fatty-acyl-phospholipid synthase-like methyltransferase
MLTNPRFPRSNQYNPEWVSAGAGGGANPLWLTEWLCEVVELRPGMRVLDLGCGRALSSVFLRREFGVEVWATDLWFSATENAQRIHDAEVGDGVFAIQADARKLPFADEFFDAVISIDSFVYYGTGDLYLNNLARFVKPGGTIAIAGAGLMQEMDGPLPDQIPDHLKAWWEPGLCCLHSAEWWRSHWSRSGIVDVDMADSMQDGWQSWIQWHQTIAPDNHMEITAVQADHGRNLGYVRVAGKRRPGVKLDDPTYSIAASYTYKPLLRAK